MRTATSRITKYLGMERGEKECECLLERNKMPEFQREGMNIVYIYLTIFYGVF